MLDKLISQKAAAGLLVVLTAIVAVTFSLLPRIPSHSRITCLPIDAASWEFRTSVMLFPMCLLA